ncbi:MAG: hypothetical protein IKZ00_06330 [Bacteroidaceae bacterium]|nr:hypothetical protein [Bacteroidaceae bacterium]
MREILFRGKRIDNGEWVLGSYIEAGDSAESVFVIIPRNAEHWGSAEFNCGYQVDPDTIGQYTGLKDKNGRCIFEGDIVEAVLPPSISQPSFVWPFMPVVFAEGVFGLQDHRGGVTPFKSFAPTVTFEIKGNVYDNPELLKGDAI